MNMANRTGSNNRSYSARASRLMGRARQEATPSRLIAAGTLAAGAAAYALLRDPERRDRLTKSARDYLDRGMAWWDQSTRNEAPSASNIAV
jgi:hypothetical protein